MRTLLLLTITCFFLSCKNEKELQVSVIQNMGEALRTTYQIQYDGTSDLHDDFKKIFETVNRSMSTYMPDSDISRINKGDTTIVVDVYFKEVFSTSKEIWERTNGYFDPTVGILVNAYGFGPTKPIKHLDTKKVDSLMQYVGFQKLLLTEEGNVKKQFPEIYIDFNAIAKGYTLDLLARVLDENQVKNYLIELGGELVAKGENPQKQQLWKVGIDNPTITDGREIFEVVQLKDVAMASSGNYRKYLTDTETGDMYVHTINPKTGKPQRNNVLSVSVLAENCMLADAYATVFMIMSLEESIAFLNENQELEVYIIYLDEKGNLQEYITEGFKKVLVSE